MKFQSAIRFFLEKSFGFLDESFPLFIFGVYVPLVINGLFTIFIRDYLFSEMISQSIDKLLILAIYSKFLDHLTMTLELLL